MKSSKRAVLFVLVIVLLAVVGLKRLQYKCGFKSETLKYCRTGVDLDNVENREAGQKSVSALSSKSTNFTPTKKIPKETANSLSTLNPLNNSLTNSTDSKKVTKVTSVLSSQKLIQPDWTSLKGDQGYQHQFYSAYYDGRSSEKLFRPAVIVMGYVDKKATVQNFRCFFTYSNSSTSCSSEPARRRHVSECWQVTHDFIPFHYLCRVSDQVPMSVRLSTSAECELDKSTKEMPVKNRDMNLKPSKKFGVCVGGPIVQKKNLLNDMIEFIEMSTFLGAEMIVVYANEAQVDKNVLEYMWEHYPNTIRTIGWGKFEKWKPFHYYGQLLMISDCFYRHMYEFEYIATMDLDEMIIPATKNSWADMINEFKNSDKAPEYMFQNAFFKPAGEQALSNCPDKQVPKYFTRTQRLTCKPGFSFRNKLISRPRFIYEPSIHWSCAKVDGVNKTYFVPPEQGIVAHYRPEIPGECQHAQAHLDNLAKRFEYQVSKRICSS